ncbi:hypothetical protein [Lewinella sp. IMCC34191]|uniref:hypothetical protein n=1 Tax=Lewinella sp. IMCC34191 TaxID=2259172 RepID=UPI001300A14C|nr:hypothetical protein [Lewinella sp. IMCC34191]
MIYRAIPFALLFLLMSACVPKTQYDSLTQERNYYRSQAEAADSTSTIRYQALTDSLRSSGAFQQRQLRQIEELNATNRSLNNRIADLTERYESILEQNRSLVDAGGNEPNLQQELLDRQAELDKRAAVLERRAQQLSAREESLTSLDRMRNDQPETYDSGTSVRGTSPVDPEAADKIRMDKLQEELRQLMLALTDTGYVLYRLDERALELVLGGNLTFTENNEVTLEGQRILRRLGGTLRNYPGLYFTIVGHAESIDGDPLLAYESSAERGVRVAMQLAQFGIDPGSIIAGGQGFYGTYDVPQLNGLDNERRTRLIIRSRRE